MTVVNRIEPEEAWKRVEEDEDAVLLDVRTGSWHESDVKAKSAYRIEPDEVEERYGELPEDREILTYCT